MKIEHYLDEVCARVKCREVHAEIRAELASHIADRVEALVAGGYAQEEAEAQALRQMGDPAEVGEGLHKAHRPRLDWGLIGLSAVLMCVGLWVAYVVSANGSWGPGMLRYQVVSNVIGAGLAAGLCFFDYRRLAGYGWWLFGGALALVAVASLRPIGFYFFGNPIIFVPGLAALSSRWDWARRWAGWQASGLALVPALCYLALPELRFALLYLVIWAVLVLLSRPRWLALWPVGVTGLAGTSFMAWWVMGAAYRVARLQNFVAPWSSDPMGGGFVVWQSRLALKGAGLWGHGPFARNDFLPEVHTDFVFPYLVHTLGWVAGAAICVVILLFLVRIGQLAGRSRNRFGHFLVAGCLTAFAVQAVWNIGMAAGFLPIVGLDLPFISYGRQQILQLAAVGLILSVWRRKDLRVEKA